MTHLITGYKGEEHIQSKDQRSYNMAMFGAGEYVLEIGNELEASIINNNTVRVLDGDLLMQGGHIRIETNTYEDMNIETGTAGVNRNDLIVMTYEKIASDGTETAYLEVLHGEETSGVAQDPECVSGVIAEGALKNQMPLYRVRLEGVVLAEIVPLFNTLPTYKTIAERYAAQFRTACETFLNSLSILDTREEIEANTLPNQLAGALAVKEIVSGLNTETIRYVPGEVDMIQIKDENGVWHNWKGGGLKQLNLNAVQNSDWIATSNDNRCTWSFAPILLSAIGGSASYIRIYTADVFEPGQYSELQFKFHYTYNPGAGDYNYVKIMSEDLHSTLKDWYNIGYDAESSFNLTDISVRYRVLISKYAAGGTHNIQFDKLILQ